MCHSQPRAAKRVRRSQPFSRQIPCNRCLFPKNSSRFLVTRRSLPASDLLTSRCERPEKRTNPGTKRNRIMLMAEGAADGLGICKDLLAEQFPAGLGSGHPVRAQSRRRDRRRGRRLRGSPADWQSAHQGEREARPASRRRAERIGPIDAAHGHRAERADHSGHDRFLVVDVRVLHGGVQYPGAYGSLCRHEQRGPIHSRICWWPR